MTDSTPVANEPTASDARVRAAQLKQAVLERADAVSDWAQDRARLIADTAKEKPLAAAGVSAGAAFAAGLVFGLLLAQALQPPPRSWRDKVMDLKPGW